MTRNFLDIDDLSAAELDDVLVRAEDPRPGAVLAGRGVAMVFEKPSARTRNSTELAAFQLGGHPVYIQGTEVGLDVRESVEDVARTLACYHALLCARVFSHPVLERMAAALDQGGFDVPVVNLLSDRAHPCQAVADLLTLRQVLADGPGPAPLGGRVLTYVGDANNMWRSLAKAGVMVGMEVRIAAPPGFGPDPAGLAEIEAVAREAGRGGRAVAGTDPAELAAGADALYTDVWTSMGQEAEAEARRRAFAGYTVDEALLAAAGPGVKVLHCLPAHRGEEISAGVLEGPASVVWTQAGHRLTAMRGLFLWLAAQAGGPG